VTQKKNRLAAVLKVAKLKEDKSTAAHAKRLREIEAARQRFIDAQHRATPQPDIASVDELQRRRELSAASARTALIEQAHLTDQIERAVKERNEMLADMRYRRTVERIDEKHKLAWAALATQAAERAMDDIAVAGWQRRNR
jgi:flagellar biosynthesis chaperone FliJ